jgi:hypothetical protein
MLEEKRQRICAIVAAWSGDLFEKFAFYAYASCAIYFAPAFFGALSDRLGRRSNSLLLAGLGALVTVPVVRALRGRASMKAEMFPSELRAPGLQSKGHEPVFYGYETAMPVIAFLFSPQLPKHARYRASKAAFPPAAVVFTVMVCSAQKRYR